MITPTYSTSSHPSIKTMRIRSHSPLGYNVDSYFCFCAYLVYYIIIKEGVKTTLHRKKDMIKFTGKKRNIILTRASRTGQNNADVLLCNDKTPLIIVEVETNVNARARRRAYMALES